MMESIQSSPLARKVGITLICLLCLLAFFKMDFNNGGLDQIDLTTESTTLCPACPIPITPTCPTCPSTTCPTCPTCQKQDRYFANMATASFWKNGQYILNIYDVYFADTNPTQLWKNGDYTSLYNLSYTEIQDFFKYKEQQYKDRKERIFRMCPKLPKLSMHVSHTTMDTDRGQYVVDPKDGLGMCRIAKVSSSAWLYRFNMLLENGRKNFSEISHSELVKMHSQAHKWWNLTKDQQIEHMNGSVGDILSFVMVRHPFDRLVSAYYDKIIGKFSVLIICTPKYLNNHRSGKMAQNCGKN